MQWSRRCAKILKFFSVEAALRVFDADRGVTVEVSDKPALKSKGVGISGGKYPSVLNATGLRKSSAFFFIPA